MDLTSNSQSDKTLSVLCINWLNPGLWAIDCRLEIIFGAKTGSQSYCMQIVDTFLLAAKHIFWAKFWSQKIKSWLSLFTHDLELLLSAYRGELWEKFIGTELTFNPGWVASSGMALLRHLEAWAVPLDVLIPSQWWNHVSMATGTQFWSKAFVIIKQHEDIFLENQWSLTIIRASF